MSIHKKGGYTQPTEPFNSTPPSQRPGGERVIPTCPYCSGSATSLSRVGNIMSTYWCDDCNRAYAVDNVDLSKPNNNKKKEEPMDLTNRTCLHCNGALIHVYKKNSTTEIYECIECNKLWEETTNPETGEVSPLQEYVLNASHSAETKCGCPYCDSVDIHQYPKRSTGCKNFKCNACGKCFSEHTKPKEETPHPPKCPHCESEDLQQYPASTRPTGYKDFKCNCCGEVWSISKTKPVENPVEEPKRICPNCQWEGTPDALKSAHPCRSTWTCKCCGEVWSLNSVHPREEATSELAEELHPTCIFCASTHTDLFTPLRTPERTNPGSYVKCLDCSCTWPLGFVHPTDYVVNDVPEVVHSNPLDDSHTSITLTRGSAEAWICTCPCGVTVSYPTDKLPTVNTRMPCGIPNHWAVYYADSVPSKEVKAFLWADNAYIEVPFKSLRKGDVFALTDSEGVPMGNYNGSLAATAAGDAHYNDEVSVWGIKSYIFELTSNDVPMPTDGQLEDEAIEDQILEDRIEKDDEDMATADQARY